MSKSIALILILLSALVAACSPPVPQPEPPAPDAVSLVGDARSGTMRLEVPADADVEDIPWLIAVDSLKEQGYAIEALSLSDTAVEIVAMAQGDLDIAGLSHQVTWSAVSQGAPVVTIVDKSANSILMVSSKAIEDCSDLDGKSVAVPSLTSVTGAMLNAYLAENCPGVKPQTIVVSGGSNRIAALLSGEVDVAGSDIDRLLKLENERPGEYHALISFAEESPDLYVSSYMARREFLEQHPEMVKDVIRALFAARRRVQDAQVLQEAIAEYLEIESVKAQAMAETYLERIAWDVSGAFTLEAIQATVDFLQEYGDLPEELEAEDVADLSYYNDVLEELGLR